MAVSRDTVLVQQVESNEAEQVTDGTRTSGCLFTYELHVTLLSAAAGGSSGGVLVRDREKEKEAVDEGTRRREQLDKDDWWRVILHDDDIHTFDYVSLSIVKVSSSPMSMRMLLHSLGPRYTDLLQGLLYGSMQLIVDLYHAAVHFITSDNSLARVFTASHSPRQSSMHPKCARCRLWRS